VSVTVEVVRAPEVTVRMLAQVGQKRSIVLYGIEKWDGDWRLKVVEMEL